MEAGRGVIDVGTDHGYFPVWMASHGYKGNIIASDINAAPLKKAMDTAMKAGVEDKIQFQQCDGLENCRPDSVDTIVIAGMGGELIAEIVDSAKLPENATLVLSPMTGAEKLRKSLYLSGFEIIRETLVGEEDKIYTVMKAKKTENAGVYQEINEYFSEALLSEKNGLLHDYIRRYISKFDKALEGRRESGKKHSDEEEIEKLRNEMIKLEESI